MRIVHPQQPVNGLNPEDVFYAVDDLGTQTGYGFILYQLQPGLYPDCPVNLYFSIDGDAASRYLLFGALVARARVLQNVNPQLRARLYTSISPADAQMKDFYVHNGFDCDETDDILQLTIPLNALRRMPHFMVLGLYRNAGLIGEVIMAGQGSDCELVAIYIEPSSRRQGMARALLHRMMAIMAAEGVTRVTTRIMSRSQPQQRLMNDFGGTVLGINMLFPGMYLN